MCDELLPRFKTYVETLVSEQSTEVPLTKLSNSIGAPNEDEDCRGEQEKEEGDHWLVEAMSRGRLGGCEDVVGEQGTETNKSDDLEDKAGKGYVLSSFDILMGGGDT